jgi:putative transcriptional regulator
MFDDSKEKLAKRVAGEIALSYEPGKTMKKWREVFGTSQTDLAEYLNVSSSVISDYEGGRRRSPGSSTIKRVVEGLISIDERRGGKVIQALSKMQEVGFAPDVVIDMREFPVPVPSSDLIRAVEGEVLALQDLIHPEIYGYTVIDSIKAILKMTADEFTKLYGWTTERALIFTEVTMGRSPMIAIKVKGLKPSIIVLHGPVTVEDPLAVKLAELERIPLVLSHSPNVETLISNLRKL